MTVPPAGSPVFGAGPALRGAHAVPPLALATLPVDDVALAVARVVGIAVMAAALAGVTATVYRWYVRERVPTPLSVLVGLATVAVYLNTTTALGQAIGSSAPFDLEAVAFNGATLLVSFGTALVGTRVGDGLGQDVFVATGGNEVDVDVGRVVRAVGRVITVEIPEDVDDIVGYDPVPDATREKLEGRTFVFPRRLTVEELRDRLVTRLKSDYGVGYVDLELSRDGTVEYLALGSRVAGIGPTLPPETAAVAIQADPAHAASAGDLVQVWQSNPPERVLTAEVRATADDVVTLAVDVADTLKLDDATTYKLVTLPVETRPDREFASLLRAADETMAAVPVEADSVVEGQPLRALAVSVVAVRDAEDHVEPVPSTGRVIVAGDTLYVVARPEALRKLETAASTPVDAAASAVSTPDPDTAGVGTEPQASDDSTADDATPDDSTADDATSDDADSASHDVEDEPARDDEPTDENGTADEGTTADEDTTTDRDTTDEDTDFAAGGKSFSDLKAEFESGDADWDDTDVDESTADTSPANTSTADTSTADTSTADTSGDGDAGVTSGRAGKSFEELKDEFESETADWDDDVEIGGMALEPETEAEKELARKVEDEASSGTPDDSSGESDDGDGDDGNRNENGNESENGNGNLADDELFDDTVEADNDDFGDPFDDDEASNDDLDD
ncbi:MAG: cation:proton antiporter regulatory subunit, partial [Haloarculaceae archaeon]